MQRLQFMLTLRWIACLFWLFGSHPALADACHPTIDATLPQYIVGYGSLIDEASKKRTDPTAKENMPIRLAGYQRGWFIHGDLPGLNTTFLSIVADPKAAFNGVIYQLSHPENIQEYDTREMGYCRTLVQDNQLTLYAGTLPKKKQIWVYVSAQTKNEYPSPQFPIVQSYVDIFVRGCIQLEEHFKLAQFAKECINSTAHWSNDWENDRIYPRRPFIYEPNAAKIDALLKETLPQFVSNTKQ